MVEQFHNPNSFICFTTHQMKHFYSPALRSQELGFRVRGKEMITWILLSNLISKMDVALRTCLIKGRPFQKILGRWLNEPVWSITGYLRVTSTNQIKGKRALPPAEPGGKSNSVRSQSNEERKHVNHPESPSLFFFNEINVPVLL